MNETFSRILATKRKHWWRSRSVFQPHAPVSESELATIERQLECTLPSELREWLLQAGYGDINEELSFRRDWFRKHNKGNLAGNVFFAQDILGNFYAFEPHSGAISFFSRTAPEYGSMSPDFGNFMEELERREFKLEEWIDSLEVLPDEDA